MSATTIDYIKENQVEANALNQLLSLSASICVITAHVFMMCVVSHSFKKYMLKVVKTGKELLDEDGSLVATVEEIQRQIKGFYIKLDDIGSSSFWLSLNKFILKRTFNNFELIIININEHDADIDITNGNVSGPFHNVEDLMSHLNS
jgi:hypothetical protein